MTDALCTCPACKGKGVITVSVTEVSPDKTVERSESELTCYLCHGEKQVLKAVHDAHIEANNSWCRCGNPSGDAIYYDDNQLGPGSKHCWCCKDCGKLLQVG